MQGASGCIPLAPSTFLVLIPISLVNNPYRTIMGYYVSSASYAKADLGQEFIKNKSKLSKILKFYD